MKKTRNPIAGSLRLFRQQKVRPKKGKGSYNRKEGRREIRNLRPSSFLIVSDKDHP